MQLMFLLNSEYNSMAIPVSCSLNLDSIGGETSFHLVKLSSLGTLVY